MSAGHLQVTLPRGLGLGDSVEDVLRLIESGAATGRANREGTKAVRLLSLVSRGDGSVDWMKYWKLKGFQFKHLCMRCDALSRLVKAHPRKAVDRNTFGKAGISLSKHGISNLEELGKHLTMSRSDLSGLGITKIEELFARLLEYMRRHEAGEPVFRAEVAAENVHYKSPNSVAIVDHASLARLNESVRSLPIDGIHIGPKSRSFSDKGINTLGDLAQAAEEGFGNVWSVGAKTISRINAILSAISLSVDEQRCIDWSSFTKIVGIPTIPQNIPSSGKEFVHMLPHVCDELIIACNDDIEREIFANRLTQKRSNQKTLEEIGSKAGVTRERIRQKEKKLLQSLSDALLYDEYNTLEYRFSEEFAMYFKKAADAFQEGGQEITFEIFLSKLEVAWEVGKCDILPHMALVTAILTLKAVRPPDLRNDRLVPVSLWDNLPVTISEKPIAELAVGKCISEFQGIGINTLGEAIGATIRNDLPFSKNSRTYKHLESILKWIAETLEEKSGSNSFWLRYADRAGLKVVPTNAIRSPLEFLESAYGALQQTISSNCQYSNAVRVFELRTSRPIRERFTLKKVGEALGIVGPHVKRTEVEFVKMLNAQLIEKDFSKSKMFFRHEFLEFWGQAREVYENTRDFRRFKSDLASKWQLDPAVLEDHVDVIWTILNIYPHGRNIMEPRKYRRKKRSPIGTDGGLGSVIKLRGFRRIH